VEVRPGEERDLDSLNALYNHYVRTSAATFDIDEVPLEYHRRWFDDLGGPYKLLVAYEEGAFAGYAYSGQLSPRRAYETSVVTSVYLADNVRGRGIGTALYGALFASLEGEDLHRAYAGITVPNPASFALHERFGFRRVAVYSEQGRKFDRYWDVAWFEKHL
jgi:phosphinothricin acetyltransferase